MSLQRTPLFESCRSAGGRMVPFAGWEMPVQFSGLIQEHKAVRERVGMFDISHMGVLRLEGANPKDALQKLIPSDLHRIGPGEACYSVLLNERGGIRDDLIVYDCGAIDAERGALVLVINAACADSDTAWIREQMEPAGLTVTDIKKDGVLLALQGPEAMGLLQELSGEDLSGLPRFGHRMLNLEGLSQPVFSARTGYTGEDGAELLLNADDGQKLWQRLLDRGVTPCGLGARDTLRLEAAMHLYGQDMNDKTKSLRGGVGLARAPGNARGLCGPTGAGAGGGIRPGQTPGGAQAAGSCHRPPRLPRDAQRRDGGHRHQRHLVTHLGRSDRPGLRAAVPRQARHRTER